MGYTSCIKVKNINHVILATDDIEIMKVANDLNIESFLTSKAHKSGTERVLEQKVDSEFFINLQEMNH